jgi:hypothetical protein
LDLIYILHENKYVYIKKTIFSFKIFSQRHFSNTTAEKMKKRDHSTQYRTLNKNLVQMLSEATAKKKNFDPINSSLRIFI